MIVTIKRKAFGDKVIFSSFECEIKEGKTTSILGRSGVGKTTLLRIIAGLDKEFEGEVKSPFSFPSFLFQEDRLVDNLTLMANMRVVEKDKERILDGINRVGLKGNEGTLIRELSGGMKRRAAILRALLIPYDALILDEPFTGLDEESKRDISSLILSENNGRTMIVVSHLKEDIELLKADYEIVLGGDNDP